MDDSPGMLTKKLAQQSSKLRNNSSKVRRLQKKLEFLQDKSHTMTMANVNAGIFDEKELQELNEKIANNDSIEQDELSKIIFAECLYQFQVGKKTKGIRNRRYSPLLIRFAVGLKLKMGINQYEFLRKVFPLPTGATLNKYCLLYTSPSPRDQRGSRMPSSA